jgi:predicted nuclease of predicted toxin-antitoxin system
MRIVFDQGTPTPLRRALPEHEISTAFELGWGALDNGKLLDAAESKFDVLVTTDKNLRYQQRLAGRRLAIFHITHDKLAGTTTASIKIAAAVSELQHGDVVEIKI